MAVDVAGSPSRVPPLLQRHTYVLTFYSVSTFAQLRTLTYEVLTEVVVALYLHENDSKLPLFFVCLHILLNLWKISKFVRSQWKVT